MVFLGKCPDESQRILERVVIAVHLSFVQTVLRILLTVRYVIDRGEAGSFVSSDFRAETTLELQAFPELDFAIDVANDGQVFGVLVIINDICQRIVIVDVGRGAVSAVCFLGRNDGFYADGVAYHAVVGVIQSGIVVLIDTCRIRFGYGQVGSNHEVILDDCLFRIETQVDALVVGLLDGSFLFQVVCAEIVFVVIRFAGADAYAVVLHECTSRDGLHPVGRCVSVHQFEIQLVYTFGCSHLVDGRL